MQHSSSFKKMIIEENDSFLLHFPIRLIRLNILPSSDFESNTWQDTVGQIERSLYLNKVRSTDDGNQNHLQCK